MSYIFKQSKLVIPKPNNIKLKHQVSKKRNFGGVIILYCYHKLNFSIDEGEQ
jgi:hypothetical protein